MRTVQQAVLMLASGAALLAQQRRRLLHAGRFSEHGPPAVAGRPSTFASNETDLMSRRAQRVSCAVTQATPFAIDSALAFGNGAANANTVRGSFGRGA